MPRPWLQVWRRCVDTARTFGGKLFKLHEHIERLYRSLRYVGIDPGLSAADMSAITEQVVERNRHLLSADEDYWVTQRISRGIDRVAGESWPSDGPTVIIECTPLPLRARAALFRDGIDIVTPAIRRVPPDCLSPNVKSHNYLNLVVADLEVRSRIPEGWAILLDTRGFLCEGLGSNVFLVKQGALYTPKAQYVLDGVSRQTVMELAKELSIPTQEADLTLYDAYTADEAFITSTSLCLCPVRSCNAKPVGTGHPPGLLTQRLMERYTRLVDFDFVQQYLRHLPAAVG
ncbi:MAG: aminotransferase class IV [Gammaproteobacteria bacterium]